MDRETILKQLNPEQAAAAAAIEGPVLVLAGAAPAKPGSSPSGSPICSVPAFRPNRSSA